MKKQGRSPPPARRRKKSHAVVKNPNNKPAFAKTSFPLYVSSSLDPTLLFGVGTLFSVCFVVGNESTMSLELRPIDEIPGILLSFLTDRAFFIGGVLLLATRWWVGESTGKSKLTPVEQRRAGWYLWNAIIFHCMMDGLAGTGYGNALMNKNYQLLDRRFKPDGGGASKGDVAVVAIVVHIELFMHTMLCLAAYVGIASGAKWQHEAELVALTFQLFGLFVFVGPEFLTKPVLGSATSVCFCLHLISNLASRAPA